MDLKLLAWGMRRKPAPLAHPALAHHALAHHALAHHALAHPALAHPPLPRLWLFTDERRLPDPRAAVAALPRGCAGVVLRHDNDPARAALGRDLQRICRSRRLLLVVAGDVRLAAALKAGTHLRGGVYPGPVRPTGLITSSAHSVRDLRRAQRAGASLVFLSPAFPTASHAGAPGLGPARWAAIARRGRAGNGAGSGIAALGGVDGRSVRRLPSTLCRAAGAIGALAVSTPAGE